MGQSTYFSFTTLEGTNTAGYTSINTCLNSIDTKLNDSNRLLPSSGGTSGYTIIWNGTAWAAGQINTAGITNLAITTGKIADSAVTSDKIADGTIVNADINASAAIDKSKISGTAVTVADSGTVTSAMIADGTIVNGDVNASAAIAYSKLALSNSITNSDIATSAAISPSKISGTAITQADTGTVSNTMLASNIAIPGTPTIGTPPTYSSGATGNSTVASTKYVTDAVSYATAGNVTLAGDVGGNASANTIGTGVVTSAKIADNTIVNGDINSSAAIAYSKLNLSNSIVAGDLTSKSVTYAKQGIVPSCKAYKSTTTSITHASVTSISLDTEEWDTGVATGGTEFHSSSTNTNRITPSVPGVYAVSGYVSWDSASSTGMRGIILNINGTASIANHYGNAVSGIDMYQSASGQVECNGTTDYIQLRVYQNSGASLTLNAAPTLAVTWLGPLS